MMGDDCPSCGGLNTSCPDGCERAPLTGELDGSSYTTGKSHSIESAVQHQADGVSEAMIEAGVAVLRQVVRERPLPEYSDTTQRIYLAMRALDPVLADTREALRFYADEWEQDADAERTVYGWEGSLGEVQPTEALCQDFGQKARAALSRSERKDAGNG